MTEAKQPSPASRQKLVSDESTSDESDDEGGDPRLRAAKLQLQSFPALVRTVTWSCVSVALFASLKVFSSFLRVEATRLWALMVISFVLPFCEGVCARMLLAGLERRYVAARRMTWVPGRLPCCVLRC